MYRNAYQRGMLTIFFSGGAKPLEIWETHTQSGYISRFLDQDIKSMVLEIGGTNVSTTFMICPKGKTVLGITMPFLVMIVKNLKKYFSFEVTILDETSTRRRFRVSNFQSTTQILPLCTVMPIGLSEGWNQIQFNLAEFTGRAYKKQFVEVQKLKINANIRLRRIYFTERLIPEDQLPPEYKLYFPLPSKGARGKKQQAIEQDKENIIPSTSQHKEAEPPLEQQAGSKLEVIKSRSKISVHTIKKSASQETRKGSMDKVEEVVEEVAVKAIVPIEGEDEVIIEAQGPKGGTEEEQPPSAEVAEGETATDTAPAEAIAQVEELAEIPAEAPAGAPPAAEDLPTPAEASPAAEEMPAPAETTE